MPTSPDQSSSFVGGPRGHPRAAAGFREHAHFILAPEVLELFVAGLRLAGHRRSEFAELPPFRSTVTGRTRPYDRDHLTTAFGAAGPLSDDRLLSEPTAAIQLWQREPLFMPHMCGPRVIADRRLNNRR